MKIGDMLEVTFRARVYDTDKLGCVWYKSMGTGATYYSSVEDQNTVVTLKVIDEPLKIGDIVRVEGLEHHPETMTIRGLYGNAVWVEWNTKTLSPGSNSFVTALKKLVRASD